MFKKSLKTKTKIKNKLKIKNKQSNINVNVTVNSHNKKKGGNGTNKKTPSNNFGALPIIVNLQAPNYNEPQRIIEKPIYYERPISEPKKIIEEPKIIEKLIKEPVIIKEPVRIKKPVIIKKSSIIKKEPSIIKKEPSIIKEPLAAGGGDGSISVKIKPKPKTIIPPLGSIFKPKELKHDELIPRAYGTYFDNMNDNEDRNDFANMIGVMHNSIKYFNDNHDYKQMALDGFKNNVIRSKNNRLIQNDQSKNLKFDGSLSNEIIPKLYGTYFDDMNDTDRNDIADIKEFILTDLKNQNKQSQALDSFKNNVIRSKNKKLIQNEINNDSVDVRDYINLSKPNTKLINNLKDYSSIDLSDSSYGSIPQILKKHTHFNFNDLSIHNPVNYDSGFGGYLGYEPEEVPKPSKHVPSFINPTTTSSSKKISDDKDKSIFDVLSNPNNAMKFSDSKTPILDSFRDFYKDKSINPYKMKLSPTTNLNLQRNYQEMQKLLLSDKPFKMENPLKDTLNKKVRSQNKSNLSDSSESFKYDNNPLHVRKIEHTIPSYSFINTVQKPQQKKNTPEYNKGYYSDKKDILLPRANQRYQIKKEAKMIELGTFPDVIDIVNPIKEKASGIPKKARGRPKKAQNFDDKKTLSDEEKFNKSLKKSNDRQKELINQIRVNKEMGDYDNPKTIAILKKAKEDKYNFWQAHNQKT
jgi:hypothetical protein